MGYRKSLEIAGKSGTNLIQYSVNSTKHTLSDLFWFGPHAYLVLIWSWVQHLHHSLDRQLYAPKDFTYREFFGHLVNMEDGSEVSYGTYKYYGDGSIQGQTIWEKPCPPSSLSPDTNFLRFEIDNSTLLGVAPKTLHTASSLVTWNSQASAAHQLINECGLHVAFRMTACHLCYYSLIRGILIQTIKDRISNHIQMYLETFHTIFFAVHIS